MKRPVILFITIFSYIVFIIVSILGTNRRINASAIAENYNIESPYFYKIHISEICSNNDDCAPDENGNYGADYIEIYNDTNEVIDISGFGLSDKTKDLFRFTFENTVVNPYATIIVWNNPGNRETEDTINIHELGFGIKAGEQIIFTDNLGNIIQSVIVPDIPYGKVISSSKKEPFQYFVTDPTPYIVNERTADALNEKDSTETGVNGDSFLNSELNGPHFIFQQTTFNILPPHNSITIKCIGETVGDDLIQYQWYQSIDGSIESKEKIEEGVNESSLTIFASDFEKPGIYYYYCGIKSIINNDEKTIISDEVLSDVIIIAYTGLPTVLVETYDGINPSSHKEKKTGKLMVFYPNGEVYDSDNSNNGKFTIHVRGNATANHPKAPYKIKLPENFNLLDPTSSKNRDREWVLLSNYTDKTLIRTKLGFFVSGMFNSIKEGSITFSV